MGDDISGGGGIVSTIIAVGVILIVMILRNRRPRKLRVELLWLRPIIFAIIVVTTITASPVAMDVVTLAVLGVALAAGAALGWQRGRLMRIDVNPETHALTTQASPIGVLLILAVLALRMLLRGAAIESRSALGLPASTITDALVLLLGAMVVLQSLEMWLRAQRLLDQARAAKAAAGPDAGAQPPLVS
jgi:hypothetical protein